MNEKQKEIVRDVLNSVRPYITSSDILKNKVEDLSEESEDLEEFKNEFEKNIAGEEDPTKKSDLRIFLNKLRNY